LDLPYYYLFLEYIPKNKYQDSEKNEAHWLVSKTFSDDLVIKNVLFLIQERAAYLILKQAQKILS